MKMKVKRAAEYRIEEWRHWRVALQAYNRRTSWGTHWAAIVEVHRLTRSDVIIVEMSVRGYVDREGLIIKDSYIIYTFLHLLGHRRICNSVNLHTIAIRRGK